MTKAPIKLYIIGNGFDLWHGIPSGYAQFKAYVRQHDRDVFEATEDYLPAGEDWRDLESALADVDVDNIIDDKSQFMAGYGDSDWSDSGHHDFQYEVERVAEQLSTELRTLFGRWIRTLKIPTPDTAKRLLGSIDLGAAFFTFNYTSTLEDLYGVPDEHVLHIHGQAKLEDSELILGHGWNPEQRPSLNDDPHVEDFDPRLIEVHGILDDLFSETFKPSARLILDQQGFFEKLGAIEAVYVLGHSLSAVDSAYFKALLQVPSVSRARWCVACRSEEEMQEKRDSLEALGVGSGLISTVLWAAV